MNELTTEKLITTKELADVLGVSNMSIKRVLDATNNLNGTVKVKNGKPTFFTEKQATLIKQEIQKHHNLKSNQINNVSTRLEVIANYKAAVEALTKMLEEENLALKQENEKLQIELDESKEWYSIKRMSKLNPDRNFKFGLLKSESVRLGYEIKKAFDQNYGEVNAYHRDVWESLYFDSINYEEL